MGRHWGLAVAALVAACGGSEPQAKPQTQTHADSSTITSRDLGKLFQQTAAHGLICRIAGETKVTVPKVCTMIMCGPETTAAAALAASPDLKGSLPALEGLPLGGIKVGGNASVCNGCVGTDPQTRMMNCPAAPPGGQCTGFAKCADVTTGHQDDDPFVSPTTVNGFTFTTTGHAFYNLSGPGMLLQFPNSGLTITLPAPSCSVTLHLGGWAGPVTASAYATEGLALDSEVTPVLNQVVEITLTGHNITRVVLTGGGGEGGLLSVCAKQ